MKKLNGFLTVILTLVLCMAQPSLAAGIPVTAQNDTITVAMVSRLPSLILKATL